MQLTKGTDDKGDAACIRLNGHFFNHCVIKCRYISGLQTEESCVERVWSMQYLLLLEYTGQLSHFACKQIT